LKKSNKFKKQGATTMNGNISNELSDLLGSLLQIERNLSENYRRCAKGENIARAFEETGYGIPVNIIPWDIEGVCHKTLIVCVGYSDDKEKRILEAYEHISAKCPDTENVVFFAAAWDGLDWEGHSRQFRKVNPILKMFFADPTLLSV